MGYPIFRIEFHFPYFRLRNSPVSEGNAQGINPRLARKKINLSFLDIAPASSSKVRYALHEAHSSVTIVGSDHARWVAYGFSDSEDSLGEDPEEEYETGFQGYDIFGIDLIADTPIWDPREYYLRSLKARTTQLSREWMYLARTVENAVEWVCHYH